jgi:hypothetical protein
MVSVSYYAPLMGVLVKIRKMHHYVAHTAFGSIVFLSSNKLSCLLRDLES